MRKVRFAVVVALFGIVGASNAQGADIVLSPGNITLTLGSGQSMPTEVNATLNNPPSTAFNISFMLRASGGNLPASWLKSQTGVLSNGRISVPVPVEVIVPATAEPGSYATTLRPVANYPLAPTLKPLYVSVVVADACASAPTVSIISSAPADFGPPNNRLENLVITGTIVVPAGCTLGRAWYDLQDEYDVGSGSGNVVVAADGSFTLAVPLTISRRGDDKDGRTYRITVRAEDEAGPAAAAPLVVTILHDQRGGKK